MAGNLQKLYRRVKVFNGKLHFYPIIKRKRTDTIILKNIYKKLMDWLFIDELDEYVAMRMIKNKSFPELIEKAKEKKNGS